MGGEIKRKRVTHLLGPVTTRGKHPPADIKDEAEKHMMTVNAGAIKPERVITVGDFAEGVFLPWVEQHNRPSTAKSYREIWEKHLKGHAAKALLKNVRTHHVQDWLNQIGAAGLSRNTLKHIKSVVSGMFKLAKQQAYFDGENPARDTRVNPKAAEPKETYAYSLDEIQSMLAVLPEPAGTAFGVAAFMGLRHGEIQGLLWENYKDCEIYISRSIWNGRATDPKTLKGRAPVPVIRQLAEKLEKHRRRCGGPKTGPMFANGAGKPIALSNLVNRVILPALNRCELCGKPEPEHLHANHKFKRDARIPKWRGWHAARRGLGSNLYRLGVAEIVIQRILRHANVSTTAGYYIKTAADDVRDAMTRLESSIPSAIQAHETLRDTFGTPNPDSAAVPATIN